MRYLEGNTGSVSFNTPITVGEGVYIGPLIWELGDDLGNFVVVDPVTGASNNSTSAVIDPSNVQVLLLTKIADGVDFRVRATYPGIGNDCSRLSVEGLFRWSAPAVWLNPFCVTVAE